MCGQQTMFTSHAIIQSFGPSTRSDLIQSCLPPRPQGERWSPVYDPMQIIGWSAGWKGVALRSAIRMARRAARTSDDSWRGGSRSREDSRHVSFAPPSRTHHGSSHQGTSRFPHMIWASKSDADFSPVCRTMLVLAHPSGRRGRFPHCT